MPLSSSRVKIHDWHYVLSKLAIRSVRRQLNNLFEVVKKKRISLFHESIPKLNEKAPAAKTYFINKTSSSSVDINTNHYVLALG